MRSAPFDWRPYIIEFHAQAPKLMRARAFVLGGDLQLRLSANGGTLESFIGIAADGEIRGGCCASFGSVGDRFDAALLANAMRLLIGGMWEREDGPIADGDTRLCMGVDLAYRDSPIVVAGEKTLHVVGPGVTYRALRDGLVVLFTRPQSIAEKRRKLAAAGCTGPEPIGDFMDQAYDELFREMVEQEQESQRRKRIALGLPPQAG